MDPAAAAVFLSMEDWTSDWVSRWADTAVDLALLEEWGVCGGERWVELVVEGVPVIVVPVAMVGVGMLMFERTGGMEGGDMEPNRFWWDC